MSRCSASKRLTVHSRRLQGVKRIITMGMIAIFLLTVVSPVLAGPSPPVTKEQALSVAREKVEIPAGLKLVNIFYRLEQSGNQVWSFGWNSGDPAQPTEINADVDAVTGRLRNFYLYSPELYRGTNKFNLAQAKAIAEKYVQTNNASEYNQLIMEAPQSDNIGNAEKLPAMQYSFRYNRIVNGHPFWDNGISITVNGVNGKVSSYSFNWDSSPIPDVRDTVYLSQAKKIFDEQLGLELGYFRRPDMSQGNKPDLGYSYPNSNGNLYIDAQTGEVIDFLGTVLQTQRNTNQPVSEPADIPAFETGPVNLSIEQAIALIKKRINVPEDYTLTNTWYMENLQGLTTPTWNFSWTGKNQGYVNAGVTVNGEITQCDTSPDPTREPPKDITQEQAIEIAKAFLKEFAPSKVHQLRTDVNYFNPQYDGWGAAGEKRPYYSFHFSRLINGRPFTDNGATVTVNGEGKVTAYWLSWEELKLQAQEEVISYQEASDLLNSRMGFDLGYARIPIGNSDGKIRLVYRLNIDPGLFVDAKTGEFKNKWAGAVPGKANITDIKGHWAQKAVHKLAELQIIEPVGAYYPDRAVTRAEAVTMLVKAFELNRYFPDEPTFADVPKESAGYGYVEAACKAGLISGAGGKFNPRDKLTREELAVILAKGLKGSPAETDAELEGFTDARQISDWARESVAVAVKSGLLFGDAKGCFNPQKAVTKGEAAAITVRLLNLEK